MEDLERTISAEERIRRAEEIYQRRKMQGGVRVSSRNVNTKSKPEFGMFKKLALQIAICSLIYFIFYLIQNSNYIFSDDVITKTREFLSYDINFQQVFNDIGNYFNKNITGFFKNNDSDEENNNEQLATEIMQNQIETDEVTENVLNDTLNKLGTDMTQAINLMQLSLEDTIKTIQNSRKELK